MSSQRPFGRSRLIRRAGIKLEPTENTRVSDSDKQDFETLILSTTLANFQGLIKDVQRRPQNYW